MATEMINPPQETKLPSPDETEHIRNLLRRIIDPEVGVNIVDLGLIYGIDVHEDKILIDMTMTSPACPMGEMIQDEMRSVLAAQFGQQRQLEITLVWVPVWNPEMMSSKAKQALGWDD